tara:strand:- start:69 stop:608 length:540 start_codon:yes stop_codon:yes gene_type:complete
MGLFDFFQGKKNNNESKPVVAPKNNVELDTTEKYMEKISNLANQGMPINQIIVKFSSMKDFPVDTILNNLSNETTKHGEDKIFEFEDKSKIIRTKHGVNSLRKIKTAESEAAEEMSKIVVEKTQKENPIHCLLEKKEFVNELESKTKVSKVEGAKEVVQEKVEEVKQEKKKRSSRFSMR